VTLPHEEKQRNKTVFSEDKRIIGTKRYAAFQKMCSEAGEFAVQKDKAAGLPITYVDGITIIKEYSDGRKEILGTIKPPVHVSKKVYNLSKNDE
jgi:hypothetical protein